MAKTASQKFNNQDSVFRPHIFMNSVEYDRPYTRDERAAFFVKNMDREFNPEQRVHVLEHGHLSDKQFNVMALQILMKYQDQGLINDIKIYNAAASIIAFDLKDDYCIEEFYDLMETGKYTYQQYDSSKDRDIDIQNLMNKITEIGDLPQLTLDA